MEFSFEPATTRNTSVPLKIKSALDISVDTQGKQQKNSICLVAHPDYGSIRSRDKVHGTRMRAIY